MKTRVWSGKRANAKLQNIGAFCPKCTRIVRPNLERGNPGSMNQEKVRRERKVKRRVGKREEKEKKEPWRVNERGIPLI
jgi:hypothetical protein